MKKSGSQGREDRKENLRSEVAQVKGQLKISHLFTKPPLSLQQQTTKDTDRLDTGSTAVKDIRASTLNTDDLTEV
ncbi:hypothetical protein Bhyg_14372 [Pseudolycoriella hygida]|uniref:Uncharacterized protein n=1 Tax=Pseudolycoriella hygida TaxID=35572 RepID=A0A9Q0RX85_9DIPT|nr:hypothetical protein Bhyg_14372 [Pseudolycoriella hygida]